MTEAAGDGFAQHMIDRGTVDAPRRFKWNQDNIHDWGVRTFGGEHDALGMAIRMNIEVGELLGELANPEEMRLQAYIKMVQDQNERLSEVYHELFSLRGNDLCAPTAKAPAECADVLIVLYQVCSRVGRFIHAVVDQKMDVNVARKWGKLPSGRHQHIPDSAPEPVA